MKTQVGNSLPGNSTPLAAHRRFPGTKTGPYLRLLIGNNAVAIVILGLLHRALHCPSDYFERIVRLQPAEKCLTGT